LRGLLTSTSKSARTKTFLPETFISESNFTFPIIDEVNDYEK
jgi:hypothetical protein